MHAKKSTDLLLQPDPKQRSLTGQYLLWPDCRDCGGTGWRDVNANKGRWVIRCACRKSEPLRFATEAARDAALAARKPSTSAGIAMRDAVTTLLLKGKELA